MEKKFKERKLFAYLRRNIYYVIMIMCVLAIGTMVLVAALNKTDDSQVDEPTPVQVDTPPVDTDPVVTDPVDTDPVVTDPEPVAKVWAYAMPVDEYTIELPYADTELVFNSTINCWKTHKGVDFKVDEGTEVKAIEDGTVISVETNILEGTVVTIKHTDVYTSVYKSLAEDVRVKAGDTVTKGAVIGIASDTAWNETAMGPHLHLEVLQDGANINPMSILPEVLK